MVRAVKKMLAACPGGVWARVTPTGPRQPAGLALRCVWSALYARPIPPTPIPAPTSPKRLPEGAGSRCPGR
jgi:hypothetical protein